MAVASLAAHRLWAGYAYLMAGFAYLDDSDSGRCLAWMHRRATFMCVHLEPRHGGGVNNDLSSNDGKCLHAIESGLARYRHGLQRPHGYRAYRVLHRADDSGRSNQPAIEHRRAVCCAGKPSASSAERQHVGFTECASACA